MILRLTLLLGALLLVGFTEPVPQPKPFDPVEAAKQGRELVAEILAQRPMQNITNLGTLTIRAANGNRTNGPIKFQAIVTETNWETIYIFGSQAYLYSPSYELAATNRLDIQTLTITHTSNLTNQYSHARIFSMFQAALLRTDANMAFAGSDFWLCDLGLEFFHWPEQKILKTELRKTRSCKVLESINPQPATNGYSRVVSWIDTESLGIIHADAYDAAGKWLKEFDPKTVKEVDGQPQLVKMEMYNRQTRSRSTIEFNFDSK